MPLMRALCHFLMACVIGGHASIATAGADRTPEEYSKVDSFVFEPLAISATVSLANVRAIGSLIEEKSQLVANRHDPKQQDDLRTLRFDGLVVEAHFPAQNLNYGYVTKIVVTRSKWKLKHGLGVGVTSKKVESVLGPPDEARPGRLKYCGDRACGTFHIEKDRVIRAEFENPVD